MLDKFNFLSPEGKILHFSCGCPINVDGNCRQLEQTLNLCHTERESWVFWVVLLTQPFLPCLQVPGCIASQEQYMPGVQSCYSNPPEPENETKQTWCWVTRGRQSKQLWLVVCLYVYPIAFRGSFDCVRWYFPLEMKWESRGTRLILFWELVGLCQTGWHQEFHLTWG